MMPSADGGRREAPQSASPARYVHFAPVDAILAEPLPFGTAWQVEWRSGDRQDDPRLALRYSGASPGRVRALRGV